ncbi:MAG: ECF transporter S component [Bacillota bacterium]|nr:ECF transporter S component [Bacillota bacterium]HHU60382.1 ECF transporter S component [Natronincola sp.]
MKNLLRNARSLTLLGLMLGITIILDLTPLGAVPVGSISATITHIPTVITGIVLGPVAGLIMGTLLGLVSLLHALTRPATVLDPLFINPLVSVLPRMFIGVVAFYVYNALSTVLRKLKTGESVSLLLGGISGSLTNTVLVFLMLYLVYAQKIVEELGAPFKVILLSVLTTNAIAEGIITGLVVIPVVLAFFKTGNFKESSGKVV